MATIDEEGNLEFDSIDELIETEKAANDLLLNTIPDVAMASKEDFAFWKNLFKEQIEKKKELED